MFVLLMYRLVSYCTGPVNDAITRVGDHKMPAGLRIICCANNSEGLQCLIAKSLPEIQSKNPFIDAEGSLKLFWCVG